MSQSFVKFPNILFTNRQKYSMVYTFINRRNDVKMFKSLVEPRAVGEFFFLLQSSLTQFVTCDGLKEIWSILWMTNFFKHILDTFRQPKKTADISRQSALVSPRNDVCETCAEIPYWWPCLWLVVPRGLQPIRSATQTLIVTRHQYRISAVVSFRGETSVGFAKCGLFSQSNIWIKLFFLLCTFISSARKKLSGAQDPVSQMEEGTAAETQSQDTAAQALIEGLKRQRRNSQGFPENAVVNSEDDDVIEEEDYLKEKMKKQRRHSQGYATEAVSSDEESNMVEINLNEARSP